MPGDVAGIHVIAGDGVRFTEGRRLLDQPHSRMHDNERSGRRIEMPKQKLTGSFVALITPFNKDGSVDFAAFRTLLKFQQDHGTSAVLIMGSTGETSMLSPEEKKKIIVESAKMKTAKMPIFFGCTGNNTDVDDRHRAFRQGQRRRRRDPRRAGLYLRAGGRHRALLPRCRGRDRSAARHLQQSAAGEERPALGSSAAHLQASELRRAQGIDRARRPGGAGAGRASPTSR